jgi:hypothetical protein
MTTTTTATTFPHPSTIDDLLSRDSSRPRLVSWDGLETNETADDQVRPVGFGKNHRTSYHSSSMSTSTDISDYNTAAMTSRSSSGSLESVASETTNAASVNNPALPRVSVSVTPLPTSTLPLPLKRKRSNVRSSRTTRKHQQQQHRTTSVQTLDGLSDDLQLYISSFLETSDIRRVMQVSHRYRRVFVSDESEGLWKDLVHRAWPWLKTEQAVLVDALDLPTPCPEGTNSANMSLLLSLACEKATCVDESHFSPVKWSRSLRRWRPRNNAVAELQTVLASNGIPAVQFTGLVGKGDRCIRADHPLARPQALDHKTNFTTIHNRSPVASSKKKAAQFLHKLCCSTKSATEQRWRPFVAPFRASIGSSAPDTTLSGTHEDVYVHLTPRLISYFEVRILEAPRRLNEPTTLDAFRNHNLTANGITASECVAVGIANAAFTLHARMPGWDPHSYGYHGDDGGIFHASGHMVKTYGPTYGVGDVVGCGIDYVHGVVFYTLNGRYLGQAFVLSPDDLHRDWYPVVGMDTNCLVQCNFGVHEPFLFDLQRKIESQRHLIVDTLLQSRSSPTPRRS